MIPNGSITVASRRVLLIENSATDRQLLRNWLNAEMIETYEAVDIITALSACQKYQPNLVLLQLRLNTWDGYEVIRRLKEDPRTRSIPVIFLAASALTAEKAKGIDMGAVDFVSKPFDSVELLARVNSALRTKALLDLLEQRAHLDGLTELGNRFALQDTLPREFAACQAKGVPLSVVIADIDHFKKVNDHYGHAAGDEVLRRMAMVLRGSVRPTDFLARYGGEEFVVLCPDCDLATALRTAEGIREKVADLRVTFRNSLIQMTTSVGVNCVEPQSAGEAQDAVERADQSLYRAKASGRNAVWYWHAESQKPTAAKEEATAASVQPAQIPVA
jgi:diguanylate cyclase (GGDEF)-like protein